MIVKIRYINHQEMWMICFIFWLRPRFQTSYLFRVFARDLHGSWPRKLRNRRRCCCLSDWKMATFLELKRMCGIKIKYNIPSWGYMKKPLLLSIVLYDDDTYYRNECIEETYHSWSMVIPPVTWVLFMVVWWKCLCVCRPMSQTFPNPLPVKMHQLYNSGWFNLEKNCPQIQPISISRNTWKPPLKSGASYQAYIVSGKVLNLTSAAIFLGVISGINDKQRRFAISPIPGLPATFCEVPGIWCPHWRHWRQRSGRKWGGNPEIPILMDKNVGGHLLVSKLDTVILGFHKDFVHQLHIFHENMQGFRWRSFH